MPPNHERWLVSYADFITLLFAFFVVMYATAQIDKHKMSRLSAAIKSAFQEYGVGPVALNDENRQRENPESKPQPQNQPSMGDLEKELEKVLAAEIARHEVALRTGPDGLVISLREVGFFDSGSPSLKANSRSALDRMVKTLAQHNYRIRIEGHTDNVPIHNALFASNWELSTARATDLVRLLVTQYGFTPDRLSAAGYAEFHPVTSNDTEQGRAMNRRLDVVVLREAGTAAAPDKLELPVPPL